MNNNTDKMDPHSDDAIVELVAKAKHRPLPRSSKALFLIVIFAMVFTGGIAYGKYKATSGTGTGLSLSALGGAGGFGGGFAGGFNGRGPLNPNGGTGAGPGTETFGGTTTTTVASDVVGTVVSVGPKSVVVTTLDGSKQTFPITDTTRVRSSTTMPLADVKAGDIVTIKPDDANAAKTIMVVK